MLVQLWDSVELVLERLWDSLGDQSGKVCCNSFGGSPGTFGRQFWDSRGTALGLCVWGGGRLGTVLKEFWNSLGKVGSSSGTVLGQL